jgi:hypothetical protein
MGTFEEREKSSERKFEYDQELNFKIKARRDKLMGLWAAECLGLAGDEAQTYAHVVLQADLEKSGVDDIVAKICDDFRKRGVAHDEIRVRAELDRCAAEAKKQLGPQ